MVAVSFGHNILTPNTHVLYLMFEITIIIVNFAVPLHHDSLAVNEYSQQDTMSHSPYRPQN